jgi:Ca-activated chloride channel family protein
MYGRYRVVARRGEGELEHLLAYARRVTEISGGKAFLARDGDELREVYREIDALERSQVGARQYLVYHERYHLFLVPAVALLVIATLLNCTLLRRLP